MIYITGDTHSDTKRFASLADAGLLTESDFLIVCGDFGMVYKDPETDDLRLDELAVLPYTILFVCGNHECFPRLSAYPQEVWNGGKIHRLRWNVIHLMRGQVFTLEGRTLLTMGGGASADRVWRTPGINWWPEELPSEEEYEEAVRNLKNAGGSVDFIISHAAPYEAVRWLRYTGELRHNPPDEESLQQFLQYLYETASPEMLYFGHLHLDSPFLPERIGRMRGIYRNIHRLDTGETVLFGQPE